MRTRVLGPDTAARIRLRHGAAPGWRAVYACGHPFPVLVPCRGDAAPGLVVEGLDRLAVRRLMAYENPGYRVGRIGVAVEGRSPFAVSAFLPTAALRPAPRRWDLELWRAAYIQRLG